MPWELHTLLERCRTGEAPAWERFAEWVKVRSRVVLGGVDKLSDADGEDAVAEALKSGHHRPTRRDSRRQQCRDRCVRLHGHPEPGTERSPGPCAAW